MLLEVAEVAMEAGEACTGLSTVGEIRGNAPKGIGKAESEERSGVEVFDTGPVRPRASNR